MFIRKKSWAQQACVFNGRDFMLLDDKGKSTKEAAHFPWLPETIGTSNLNDPPKTPNTFFIVTNEVYLTSFSGSFSKVESGFVLTREGNVTKAMSPDEFRSHYELVLEVKGEDDDASLFIDLKTRSIKPPK